MGTFGTTLRTVLAERGSSQAALARQLGISPQAVSGWITGSNTPTRDNVARIEEELDVQPRGSLIRSAGYATEETGSATVESLLRSDPGLADEDKRVLLRIIALARHRHSSRSLGRYVDIDDPREVELWAMDDLSEAERWALIEVYRAERSGAPAHVERNPG